MSRSPRVRVYMACSLDGFIAGPDDDLSWLSPTEPEPPPAEPPQDEPTSLPADSGALSFEAFMAQVGAMLMGRRTYDVVAGMTAEAAWPYGELPVLVATRRPLQPSQPTVRAISGELRSAAMIDGCHDWRILFSIMIPQARPALTALIILQFTWIWNDFLWPLILIQTERRMTIQMGIMQLRGQYGLAWGSQAAAYLVATIPTLLIFLFMQKHFIRGLTMGAIKE